MKSILKRAVAILLVLTLSIGIAQTTHAITAQAASKLTKEDFKFTGIYKSVWNKVIRSKQQRQFVFSNIIDEEHPKKCIKTKRGITLLSTKAQVFRNYGKVSLKKLKSNPKMYKELRAFNKRSFNLIKNELSATYTYKSGSTVYKLTFFFDKKNKVNSMIISKNY